MNHALSAAKGSVVVPDGLVSSPCRRWFASGVSVDPWLVRAGLEVVVLHYVISKLAFLTGDLTFLPVACEIPARRAGQPLYECPSECGVTQIWITC